MAKKNKNNPIENPDRLNRLVEGTVLEGNLKTESSLRVDGKILGDINCSGRLVVGKEGVVIGNINALEVELNGKVEGQIQIKSLLTLHQTATVKGDITTERVVIEDGAQIEGQLFAGIVSNTFEEKKNKEEEMVY